MPRDANGNYTLPSGNPVITGTTIESAWANSTMEDLKQAMTDSLDRYGRGGMLAPFRFVDGTAGQPGMSWASELSTGFYRAGAGDQRATVAGVPRMRWTSVGVDVWDPTANAGAGGWSALSNASGVGVALLAAENRFTNGNQVIVAPSAGLQLWKDATPSLGARFNFNTAITDGLDLSYFTGTGWVLKYGATATASNYCNDQHTFLNSALNVQMASMVANGMSVGNVQYGPIAGNRYLGRASNEAGAVQEIGVHHVDGATNPRACLFAYGDGATTGVVGLDWVFQTGVDHFQFRRAGTTVFRYNLTGLEVLSGANMVWRSPNNAVSMTLQHNGSAGQFFTGSGAGNLEFWPQNTYMFTLAPTGAVLRNGTALFFNNAGDTFSSFLFRSDASGVIQLNNAGTVRGGLLHNASSSYQGGLVTISSSAAPATGNPGDQWLQVT